MSADITLEAVQKMTIEELCLLDTETLTDLFVLADKELRKAKMVRDWLGGIISLQHESLVVLAGME